MKNKLVVANDLKKVNLINLAEIICEVVNKIIMQKLELDEIKNIYTEPLDEIIKFQEELYDLKFIGGNFKVTYIDSNHYGISYDLYFKEGNNCKECIVKSSKSKPLNSDKDLKPEAISELREKKTIVYEINPPNIY